MAIFRFSASTAKRALAYDPRLPAEAQAFDCELGVVGGPHRVAARILRGGAAVASVAEVAFAVK